MISKKLIHQVVAFLNNYLGIRNVVCGYTYYGKDYISVEFKIWNIKGGIINECIVNYSRYIDTENGFNELKHNIIETFDGYLAIAKSQSDN